MWPLGRTDRAARARYRDEGRLDKRDPAPSRLSYKIERLWLTPIFRLGIRVGVPFALVFSVSALWLADAGRRDAIRLAYERVLTSIQERPEFMVTMMAVDGASEPVDRAIRSMLPVELPVSSFQLDLEAMRATIEQIDAVASAELHVRKGGVLQITVAERQPEILWRSADGLEMLDRTGQRVATLLDRAARPELPVIAGDGADARVDEALKLIAASGPLGPRVRGLIRIGERRWDVVLDRDQRILLPEYDPVSALQRVAALDSAQDMMARDITIVDMRNPARPTVRLAAATSELLTSQITGASAP
ncbi:MAG TPA: cell division protein FtsQ/DivIB [Albidovulum sp.]|uniref:cell division protein FtsQ/DivIB n=1 Tax=Albidovulum sp. TaxID=1872424 RepID=UPI002CF81845|nr:cell division protein FtsQ/DivIB [Albidovulum sp.]